MSCRNRYLSAEVGGRAVALYDALTWAKGAFGGGERRAEALERGMQERVAARGLEVQYARVVDAGTLEPVDEARGGAVAAVALIAAKLGATRLIDNMGMGEVGAGRGDGTFGGIPHRVSALPRYGNEPALMATYP
jgi:pantoate--beta-alanine ligase